MKLTDAMEEESKGRSSRRVLNPDAGKLEKNRQDEAFQVETEKLLACPCLDDLKQGPCGDTFKKAFRCFILSKSAEKGAECKKEFTTLELCIQQHKEMFKPAHDRNIPKQELSIPPVPASNFQFHKDFKKWSSMEKDTDKDKDKEKKNKEKKTT